MLVRREILEKVAFNEDMFLDWVDVAFCLDVRRETGARIVIDWRLRLPHSIGDCAEHRRFGRTVHYSHYPAFRLYWLGRNVTILHRGHFEQPAARPGVVGFLPRRAPDEHAAVREAAADARARAAQGVPGRVQRPCGPEVPARRGRAPGGAPLTPLTPLTPPAPLTPLLPPTPLTPLGRRERPGAQPVPSSKNCARCATSEHGTLISPVAVCTWSSATPGARHAVAACRMASAQDGPPERAQVPAV